MPVKHFVAVVMAATTLCTVALPLVAAAEQPAGDEDITVQREVAYREGSKSCTMDIAVPKAKSDRPRPVILVIHGGGWLEGDKSSFVSAQQRTPGNILDFAKRGFVAAAVNYRMSREAIYPAAVDDCRAAVRWLRAHAEQYQIDPARFGAYGNSAGGHLALLLALASDPPTLARDEPFDDQSSRVQAAVSDSGPLDLVFQHQQNELRVVVEMFLGGPPDGQRLARYREASPVSYTAGKVPPLLLIYGEADTQVNVKTADRFVAALSQAGHKNISYVRLAGVDHCPHSLVRIAYLQQVVMDFFVRTLGPPESKD